MPGDAKRILILGGTGEARALAARLDGDERFSPITSLAGRTRAPAEVAGEVRSGGFGGVAGLKDFIGKESIALLVDATHPFAARISANAAEVCAQTGVPCLRLERPPWTEQSGDDWTTVADIGAAAEAIPKGARALVTVGRQGVAPFFARDDIHVVARMIEPPEVRVPGHAQVILARAPFTPAQEKALMKDKRITLLVTRNSGGETTYAKVQAARELGLPVIIVSRPDKPPVPTASGVDDMMALIAERMT